MKKIIIGLSSILASQAVFADSGTFCGAGYGMMSGGFGWGLWGLLYFALGAFIISSIFWLTYNWIVKNKKPKK